MIFRTRHYAFLIGFLTVLFLIGAATYGGSWGFFFLGWLVDGTLLVVWGGSQLARVGARKIIGFGFSASLGADSMLPPFPAILDANGAELWPESECHAMGGAKLGSINIGETGEFVIFRKGLGICTAPPGQTIPNIFVNGWAKELSRPDHIRYSQFAKVRPHLLDPRFSGIPREWFDIIIQHDKWSWRDSVIWVVDMPVHPLINLDTEGDFILHAQDGSDPCPLRAVMPTVDEAPPGTVLLDMVHKITGRAASQVQTLQDELARLRNGSRAEADHFANIVNKVTDVDEKVARRGGLSGYIYETINPDDQPNEGVGR
jgi:hypothetical protein